MTWLRGLRRVRIVGTIALVLGVLLCGSVLLIRAFGYAPDPSFAPLFASLWPTGLVLAILGGLLLVTAWILHGFVPAGPSVSSTAEPVTRQTNLDR